jgi:DNA polymerase-4
MDGAVVEVLGWDEAFVGVRTGDPEVFARRVQIEVLAATRLHCSMGIGGNKIRAEDRHRFGKPRGVFRLTAANWFEVMGHRPTIELWASGRGSRHGWASTASAPWPSWPTPTSPSWSGVVAV